MTTMVILSGKPVYADLEGIPVGAYDVIRDDIRHISTVQPVNRVFVERTEAGYRGIIYSHEKPHMFVLNGNGFVSKPVEDSTKVLDYCNRLEDDERAITTSLDGDRADHEIEEFNELMHDRAPDDDDVAGIPEDASSDTVKIWGPEQHDPIERVPGAYRQMKQGAPLKGLEGKQDSGVCGGGVVMNKDGKVLLVKPTNGHGGYDWTFPKGYPAKVDEGHREQTAVREVSEETGYRVFAKRFLGRFSHNDGGVCDYYECDVDGSKPVGDFDKKETADVKWCTFVEALELLNDDVDVRILAHANNLLPKLLIKGGHTGTMIALHLPEDVAKKIALPGGEDPASLHITLAYLGKGLSDEQKKTAASVVRKFAGSIVDGLRVTLGGVGRFSASVSSEGRDVVYLSVDSPALTNVRPHLVDEIKEAGLPISDAHGFVPHVTLAYVEKTDKTPIERVEPIEIKFDTISLTIADERMSFPLKLTGMNLKLYEAGRRNYEALKRFMATKHHEGMQLPLKATGVLKAVKLEKAERNVKAPGSRGGRYWIDAQNQVRYDEQPKPPKKKAKIKKVEGASVANPNSIYVHTNAMGVRFLRDKSEHEVDDENQAVVRYAPFGKNVDGLSQGEVHFIFDELYHSKAKTMDEFLVNHVQPVWDDEGGKNPFTLEAARTWMDHTLTYLEYDNAIAPGGKDLLHGRTDVDWKAMHEAVKKLPPSFDDSRHDEYKEPQRVVRNGLRKILSHFGITKPPMGSSGYLGWHERVAISNQGDIGKGLAAATHGWNGDVQISKYTYDGFLKFCETMVKDEGKTTHNALHYMRTMLHEELHGYSEMEPSAYQGEGMFVEEISTEVVARMVMRERFGHLRDTSDPSVNTLTGPGLMARGQEHTMLPSSGGSYGNIIEECFMIVAEVLAARHPSAKTDFPKPAVMFKDEAKHTLEQACLELKKHHIGVNVRQPGSHLNEFVSSFKTFTFTEQSVVADQIAKLIEGKRKVGKLGRE